MSIRNSRMGYIWALVALCSLVMNLGPAMAVSPVVSENAAVVAEDNAGPVSLRQAGTVEPVLESAVHPDSPNVAGCPVTILPTDGSTSGNERAPNSNFLVGRAVWLVTAAEAAANGLVNGTVPSAIGFHYLTAPGVVANGTLKVYLQNTADATNLKSTTFATAITGMTLVSSAAASLPNTTNPFDLPFSGGSSFTYTGGALYVAFDWSWAGPVTSAALVACNTALVNGLKGANSTGTLTSSSFRPETRLTPSVATVINDASVDFVYSLGSLPQPLVGPQTVKAVVTNRGINALSNLPVTFNLTGAETFSNMQTVVGPLAACGGQAIVTFLPFTPSALGADTVTVSVPADDAPGNSSKAKALNETTNLYSYKIPGSTALGGFGNTAPIAFLAKFTTSVAAKVSQVNLEFFSVTATTYRVIVYPDSGSGTPGLVPLYLDAADRTVGAAGPVSITLPSPIAVGPGTFYAGVEQTNSTNMSLSYDAETPVRAGAFYAAFALPPASWEDFSPLNNFKPNIGITLIQCTGAAECNDNNTCTDDACTANLCVHTNNNSTSCDGNTCSDPDQCLNGVCIPGPNPCNDNDACTTDLCAGGGGCTYTAVDCNDNNPCTNDFCVPATGCGHSNNTNACTDGNPCTIGDVCSGGVCVPGAGALPAPVQVCNNGAISIPIVGNATPYPAGIVVTGQPSYLCSVTVNLNGLTHSFPDDIDILLARLAGANAIIMSDVGGATAISNVNLTLADSAAGSIPDAGPIVSGTFKPTNVNPGTGTEAWSAPAPAPTGTSVLSVFNGTNPNGTWNLFVVDDETPDGGSMTGWCVNVVAVCALDSDCNDGNACTADTCVNSTCVHGPPPACDDGDPCTDNNCNTGSGLCENPPTVCNDNNDCTDDTCVAGTGCVYTADNTNVCSDNNLCTTPDVCLGGVCVGQNPVVCPSDGNVCTTEACVPATGNCQTTNNTNACDDGDICTTGDACGPTPSFTEDFDGVVEPNLPGTWTTGVTGSGNPWSTVSASSDTPPNSAFGFDGALVADEVLISPPIAITMATAQLTFQNRWSFESATSCFDAGVLEISIGGGPFNDILLAGGSFVSGGYTGTVSTGFSNPLLGKPAWCNASAGYPNYLTTVVNLPAAAAGQTIQLKWRIGTDTSTAGLGQNIDSIAILDVNGCLPGTGLLDCNDNNPCTDDFCDPSLGCQHADNTDNCDDGNGCTMLDKCTAGICGGTAITCNDSNDCTLDTCTPETGCVFTPITAPGEVQNVAASSNKTTYTWSATPNATQYDVVRGNVGALPVGPGGGDEVCFGGLAGPTVTDASVPPLGTAYWYLPRGDNNTCKGGYGSQAVHGVPTVARTTTTCP